jgi:hypothetical protein
LIPEGDAFFIGDYKGVCHEGEIFRFPRDQQEPQLP